MAALTPQAGAQTAVVKRISALPMQARAMLPRLTAERTMTRQSPTAESMRVHATSVRGPMLGCATSSRQSPHGRSRSNAARADRQGLAGLRRLHDGRGLRGRARAERAGLFVDDTGLVRGAVEVETTSGWTVSLTCAACHARDVDAVVVLGVPNDRIDFGSITGDYSWPIGTMDVTDDGVANPIRPADLRPIAKQERLQHTGNLFNGRVARMVRIETLMVDELQQRLRPEREIAAAIALFLEAGGEALQRPNAAHPGAALFASACASCHRGEALAGPIVSVEVIGADATATRDGERATGGYRAPSLLGVGDRRALLHDGGAADLDALLGLAPSAHQGHELGLGLTEDERASIRDYLVHVRHGDEEIVEAVVDQRDREQRTDDDHREDERLVGRLAAVRRWS